MKRIVMRMRRTVDFPKTRVSLSPEAMKLLGVNEKENYVDITVYADKVVITKAKSL